ncbi:MAG: AAA family ATPase [Acidimicrobiia bacterium]|nr:AAA family ATPase [Acidimicrobiia bacterium]
MAKIYPDLVNPGASPAERKLHAALQGLSDDWTVFHSVAWQATRNGQPSDGEADFVLVHPRHGLIMIEVKGGGIRLEGGRWFSLNPEGRHPIKNPFEQAVASKHSLIGYLRDAGLPYMDAGHAVAFPDITRAGGFGPSAPPELILDRSDLTDIKGSINRVAAHSQLDGQLSDEHVMMITRLLAPTTVVRVLLRDELAEVEARMVNLTQQQFRILDLLRRQRRALIVGGAGTGKSVLAVERAPRLAAEGFSVLLTCFNRPLAQHLAKEFDSNPKVTVYSFHSLVIRQMKKAGLEVPAHPEQEWWDQESVERLVEAAEKNGLRFDALVVDEGQDFPPQWFTALQMLLTAPDNGPFYVFADAHQAIYRPGWEPPFPGEPFELDVNCRNTVPISKVVAGIFGTAMGDLGVDGPEPVWVPVESPEGAVKAVSKQLHRLVNEGGLKPGQVAVITQGRAMAETIRSESRAGITLTGLDGNGLVCETIHRFKGLEADAVIVVLDDLDEERDRQLAYIGLSRARTMLVVIGPPTVLDQLRPTTTK